MISSDTSNGSEDGSEDNSEDAGQKVTADAEIMLDMIGAPNVIGPLDD